MSAPAQKTAKPTAHARLDALDTRMSTLNDTITELASILRGEPAPEKDLVADLIASRGLAWAKGGRAYLDVDAATAVARVLRTGTPEVVPAAKPKANVTHVVVFRDSDGVVAVHPLVAAK